MPKRSAGVLLYRLSAGSPPDVLLVHPGGPLFARRDRGVWSIPKGELDGGADARATAAREFEEELGSPVPDGDWADLGTITQRGGKVVEAWAVRGDLDADGAVSNIFEMEWPPRSGRRQSFPEVDRAGWFTLDAARDKLLDAQHPFLERLEARLAGGPGRL